MVIKSWENKEEKISSGNRELHKGLVHKDAKISRG